ncbi:MAG: pyridoxal phosphate-dependent aminotransferase [Lachnospiraceae bacterium]|nr:pyridoxal phosphate-dependent aminotransferase [Lachnospiraceae bacterium]
MSIFDVETNRRNTQSYKWDVGENELPMWVADMDFQTAPCIIEALKKRVEHGIFGYSVIPDDWYRAYIGWWKRRHAFEMEKDWLIFTTGVVPAISSTVRKLTTAAENVIVITPAYNIFFNSIYNNGRNIVENRLIYKDGVYSIDFEDLEKKAADPQSSLLILCNPHNPAGIIWDRATLARIGEICARNNVTVLSDEIHCDITVPGREYVPFASVNETCKNISVSCIAPTKTFSIAGLQTAAVCVANPLLRHRVWRALNTDEVAEGNAFACDAAIAAFEHGEEWLEELRAYLAENRRIAEEYIRDNIPSVKAVSAEATYLLWIDCESYDISSDRLAEMIREKTGLYLSEGCEYRGNGNHFLRMNLGCPRSRLLDGLDRLKKAFELIKQ